jgi:hypothetical protein
MCRYDSTFHYELISGVFKKDMQCKESRKILIDFFKGEALDISCTHYGKDILYMIIHSTVTTTTMWENT